MKLFRKALTLIIAVLIALSISCIAFAQEIKPFSADGKILSVAHGGNTMDFPKNSEQAVESAFELGADCVSIDVRRTQDGVFVLSDTDELGAVTTDGAGMLISALPVSQLSVLHLRTKSGQPSDYGVALLSDVLKKAVACDKTVIIDGAWEFRDEVYKCICDHSAVDNAIIRTNASPKEISAFIADTSSMCQVIGQYHGNILFQARNFITALSRAGSRIIYLGTKNSFGEIFRSTVLSAFAKEGYSARAAMKVWDEKESGGHPDCEATWGDLIDRGYSVIETDRISDLIAYISEIEAERASLSVLLSQAKETDTFLLNSQSRSNLESTISKAESGLITISSFEKLSLIKAELNSAMIDKVMLDSPENSSEGIFKVTPGRIAAIILVTAAIIVVQVYFYYKRADKKLPEALRRFLRKN